MKEKKEAEAARKNCCSKSKNQRRLIHQQLKSLLPIKQNLKHKIAKKNNKLENGKKISKPEKGNKKPEKGNKSKPPAREKKNKKPRKKTMIRIRKKVMELGHF